MTTSIINRLKVVALSAVLPLTALSSAHAAVSLDFTMPSLPAAGYEAIQNYYNGGANQLGDVGPNYGITFGSDALALGQYPLAPSSNTGNEPGGGNALFFLGGSDVMNVAAGFTGGFSFYYDCPANLSGSINVYSGVNDTGILLATLALPGTSINGTEPFFGNWTPIGVSFAGTAESVDFGGTANEITFADVTLGSVNPQIGNGAPDSTGWSLYLMAALGLAGAARVSRKQAVATL